MAVAGVTGVALSACATGGPGGGGGATGDGELRVVATTSILGDITQQVVGEAGSVEVLLEPGTDPHGFEPSAKQAALLREADVVVANGLELVPSLIDPLRAAEEDGANAVRVAEQVNPIPYEASPEHEGGEHSDHGDHEHSPDTAHPEPEQHGQEHGDHADHGHDHGALDPHVWLDPVRMADAVRLIGERIASATPAAAAAVRGNANDYAAQVMAMHQQVQKILDAIPSADRTLVTNHDALGYFAHRYDFEVIGTVLPGGSTLSDPSSGAISQLVKTLRKAGVSAIFADTTASTRLAETVSRETGTNVQVIQLFTGSLAQNGPASTYLGMMTTNARRIVEGLTG